MVLMAVVDRARRGLGARVTRVIYEMTEVVQQARGDEVIARTFVLRHESALQRVFELAYRLEPVRAGAFGHIEGFEILDERLVHVR
jgi:hypothetical protein